MFFFMQPKVIVSANCGMEYGRVIAYKPLLDKAIEMSDHKPKANIILNRKFMKVIFAFIMDLIHFFKKLFIEKL